METFHESASVMLRQFRALVHRQPLPMPAARLLQLTALNMFAVETTASSLKGKFLLFHENYKQTRAYEMKLFRLYVHNLISYSNLQETFSNS